MLDSTIYLNLFWNIYKQTLLRWSTNETSNIANWKFQFLDIVNCIYECFFKTLRDPAYIKQFCSYFLRFILHTVSLISLQHQQIKKGFPIVVVKRRTRQLVCRVSAAPLLASFLTVLRALWYISNIVCM